MGVAILVVQHGAALDGLLGHLRRDMDDFFRIGRRGLDCQFEGVQRVARVATGNVN